ncbi:uncharacterized protein LOC108897757 [Lates calcarifer]|uniref:Uncharacterized protein LOC108897757 n=1 Tax=Lates calcarifer TaxID=8187 RepID=A0AAJ7VGQ1_LATCA|nr:uncharacterized protein LOC108897757 [Lates calcarifer]
MDEDLAEDFDCPSLLCEELEDLETKDDEGGRRRERDEEVLNQREVEESGEETQREEKEEGGEKEKTVSGREVVATEGEEEEQVKPESRLEVEEEAQEVQMEDSEIENNKAIMPDKQQSKETKSLEEKDEQKKTKKRRGKKQSERVRNKRGVKEVSERSEEEKKSQIQEVSGMSSEESSALSEPAFGLMNSCDLSDPIYLGCGGTGLYCPPVPIPLIYSSQPPVPIQPAPPQAHGTKRPHSPLLPHSLPQQGPQPLEMEITQVYSTRRSIRYSSRGRGRALSFPLLFGVRGCGQPPAAACTEEENTNSLQHRSVRAFRGPVPGGPLS